MATYTLNNMNFSFTVRRAPKSGPTSSDKWNDTVDELARDLANIALEWNTKIVPIIGGLPNGTYDSAVNAFANGLDGKNCWVDQDSSATSDDTRYYNGTRARPNTVKEQFDNVYSTISNEVASIQTTITESSAGLTTDQKNRIGANVFSSVSSSSAASLDGKSENNRLNNIQMANDLYGVGYSLDNDGAGNLANSVMVMVDALLSLHNGNWDNDVILSHAGAIVLTQGDIQPSTHAGADDAFAGPFNDLEDDLNGIRTEIKDLRGTAAWTTTNTALYAGGATSLQGLLTATAGGGVKTAANPWGYDFDDIDNLTVAMDAIRDFTGQTIHADAAPTYSSTNLIVNGTSLETAIGALDAALGDAPDQLTALEAFVGQDNNIDSTPDYSSVVFIGQNNSLETAIGQLDAALFTVSGLAKSNFIDMDDTPGTYVGWGDAFLRVASAEDGLYFSSVNPLYDGDVVANTFVTSGTRILITLPAVSVAATGCMLTHSGMYIQSQDGTWYILTISNGGALTTTAMPL